MAATQGFYGAMCELARLWYDSSDAVEVVFLQVAFTLLGSMMVAFRPTSTEVLFLFVGVRVHALGFCVCI